jgi:hypothetical protein
MRRLSSGTQNTREANLMTTKLAAVSRSTIFIRLTFNLSLSSMLLLEQRQTPDLMKVVLMLHATATRRL